LMRNDPLLRSSAIAPKTESQVYSWIANMGLGLVGGPSVTTTAFAESDSRQLLTVCALERFFFKHQHYPESLSELQPEFLPELPLDLDDQPLRYARDPSNGRYRLWSVGLNLVDDWHGQPPPPTPRGRGNLGSSPRNALDWLLSFPAER
jgi:hypothetical protein